MTVLYDSVVSFTIRNYNWLCFHASMVSLLIFGLVKKSTKKHRAQKMSKASDDKLLRSLSEIDNKLQELLDRVPARQGPPSGLTPLQQIQAGLISGFVLPSFCLLIYSSPSLLTVFSIYTKIQHQTTSPTSVASLR